MDGAMKVVSGDRKHVYKVEHIVSGEARDTHVALARFYADRELHVIKRIRDFSNSWSIRRSFTLQV